MTQAQQALKNKKPGDFIAFQVLGGGAVRHVYADGSHVTRNADGTFTAA